MNCKNEATAFCLRNSKAEVNFSYLAEGPVDIAVSVQQ